MQTIGGAMSVSNKDESSDWNSEGYPVFPDYVYPISANETLERRSVETMDEDGNTVLFEKNKKNQTITINIPYWNGDIDRKSVV